MYVSFFLFCYCSLTRNPSSKPFFFSFFSFLSFFSHFKEIPYYLGSTLSSMTCVWTHTAHGACTYAKEGLSDAEGSLQNRSGSRRSIWWCLYSKLRDFIPRIKCTSCVEPHWKHGELTCCETFLAAYKSIRRMRWRKKTTPVCLSMLS